MAMERLWIFLFLIVNHMQIIAANSRSSIDLDQVGHSKLAKCHSKYVESLKTLPVCKETVRHYHCTSKVPKELLPNSHYATKTAYIYVKPATIKKGFQVEDSKATNIWMLIRHGTRLPTNKSIAILRHLEGVRDEIVSNRQTNSKLCEIDLEKFRQWQFDSSIDENNAGFLTSQGKREMRALVYTYHRLFPNLLNTTYTKDDFHFRYTAKQRTQESFKAFAGALFGKEAIAAIDVSVNETLLKPFDLSPEWKAMEKALQLPGSEIKKFERSNEYATIIADLGELFAINRTLTVEEIEAVYDMCRFDEAWNPHKRSIWCSMLSIDQFRVFEYKDDLLAYYKLGHGSDINKKLECDLVNDMMTRLDSPLKTTAYFAHAETLMLFLTALGALDDPAPLTADNYEVMANRLWKTSKISPFAANLAVVKYPGNKIKFLLNEKVFKFDWCDGASGVCNWSTAKEMFEARCSK